MGVDGGFSAGADLFERDDLLHDDLCDRLSVSILSLDVEL